MPLETSIPTTNGSIAQAQRILEAMQDDAFVTQHIPAQNPWEKQNRQRSQAISQLWRKIGRQVLAIHPEIVNEVAVATSDKVPTEVLRTLPYMNPMVVYPIPPVFKSWRGDVKESMRLLGFFTCGAKNFFNGEALSDKPREDGFVMPGNEQRLYATNNLDANRFAILVIMEILDEYDRPVDIEMNTLTLYYNTEMTLDETVESLLNRFHFYVPTTDKHFKVARKWMKEVMSIIVGSLFYLCSTVLEAEEVPKKVVAKKVPKRIARQPFSLYKVGWTMGAALTRYRSSRTYSSSQQGDITHQQDPQHRKAHFKMQWYGPRREGRCDKMRGMCSCGGQHREMILVQAYWTHLESLGVEGVNTMRGVPSPGKGEPARSTRVAMELEV